MGYAIALPGLTFYGVTFDVHTLLFSSLALLCGFQAVLFAVLAKLFAITEGLLPPDLRLERAFNHITLEKGLVGGMLALIAGFALLLAAVLIWRATGWGRLDYTSHATGYSRRDVHGFGVSNGALQLFHEHSWHEAEMNVLEKIHGSYVHSRRVRVLAREFSALLPAHGRILDVGCGDGLLAALIRLTNRKPPSLASMS